MIVVEREPDAELPFEPCCVCSTPTPYWTVGRKGGDVALCPTCGETANDSDIPTKAEWFQRHASRGPR